MGRREQANPQADEVPSGVLRARGSVDFHLHAAPPIEYHGSRGQWPSQQQTRCLRASGALPAEPPTRRFHRCLTPVANRSTTGAEAIGRASSRPGTLGCLARCRQSLRPDVSTGALGRARARRTTGVEVVGRAFSRPGALGCRARCWQSCQPDVPTGASGEVAHLRHLAARPCTTRSANVDCRPDLFGGQASSGQRGASPVREAAISSSTNPCWRRSRRLFSPVRDRAGSGPDAFGLLASDRLWPQSVLWVAVAAEQVPRDHGLAAG